VVDSVCAEMLARGARPRESGAACDFDVEHLRNGDDILDRRIAAAQVDADSVDHDVHVRAHGEVTAAGSTAHADKPLLLEQPHRLAQSRPTHPDARQQFLLGAQRGAIRQPEQLLTKRADSATDGVDPVHGNCDIRIEP
jgi:acyl-CoA thioesterase